MFFTYDDRLLVTLVAFSLIFFGFEIFNFLSTLSGQGIVVSASFLRVITQGDDWLLLERPIVVLFLFLSVASLFCRKFWRSSQATKRWYWKTTTKFIHLSISRDI